jgi:rRNA maturation RNase YbeY
VRRWTLASLDALHADASLAIHLVGAREITRLNLQFLQHEGSTDIITFDHGSSPCRLVGELFISVPDAVRHAAAFHTTWESELGRYILHGLLHLAGEDDLEPAARRRMKRRENALLRRLSAAMPPASLALPHSRHA